MTGDWSRQGRRAGMTGDERGGVRSEGLSWHDREVWEGQR